MKNKFMKPHEIQKWLASLDDYDFDEVIDMAIEENRVRRETYKLDKINYEMNFEPYEPEE